MEADDAKEINSREEKLRRSGGRGRDLCRLLFTVPGGEDAAEEREERRKDGERVGGRRRGGRAGGGFSENGGEEVTERGRSEKSLVVGTEKALGKKIHGREGRMFLGKDISVLNEFVNNTINQSHLVKKHLGGGEYWEG